MENELISKCRLLLSAYKSGKLGQTKMPEDSNPGFSKGQEESRLAYFTLPMSLNYQRDSYKLWEAALKTYNDPQTNIVFDVSKVAIMEENKLREYLTRYKLALLPNKHTLTWKTIASTVYSNFNSFSSLMHKADDDYLKLKDIIQNKLKKGFPYLSGPKIFNYWSFIMREYGMITLKNAEYIEIAPDTHITQCSVKLGVINQIESSILSKEDISNKRRAALKGTDINPIDMHPPLWFWSRNGFLYNFD